MLQTMADPAHIQSPPPLRRIRWWPGLVLFIVALAGITWVRMQSDWPFQKRNLTTAQIGIVCAIVVIVWWTFFSRAPGRMRLRITYGLAVVGLVLVLLFRVCGVSGDMLPVLEFRWASRELPSVAKTNSVATLQRFTPTSDVGVHASTRSAFPQFLGPDRNGVLPGPRLESIWTAHPPEIVWRRKVGAAWSGFAVIGEVCLTQEQRGEDECVVAYELTTGRQLWLHADKARYRTTIAGEGPRATPTIQSNRVFTCGATGIFNCLDLATGKRIWTRNVVTEFGGKIPQWGLASSPLLVNGLVMVHGGEKTKHSLHAFRADDGQSVWSAGNVNPSYASPTLAFLAGVPQVLAFNDGSISAHDPATGVTLWEKPWGNGNVVCASPVVVAENRVLFSSGYGVGAELLEISHDAEGRVTAQRVWKSIRMKAKFSHLFVRDGCLFGLDDGIFACVDLKDGSQRWKEGRYGHGQGLLVGELYLLMAESGELILLRPTPDVPEELARFRVFNSKTWNPMALSGNILLARNDREAVCLRLKTAP
jgi:outer membrane protein assembly factor BamB